MNSLRRLRNVTLALAGYVIWFTLFYVSLLYTDIFSVLPSFEIQATNWARIATVREHATGRPPGEAGPDIIIVDVPEIGKNIWIPVDRTGGTFGQAKSILDYPRERDIVPSRGVHPMLIEFQRRAFTDLDLQVPYLPAFFSKRYTPFRDIPGALPDYREKQPYDHYYGALILIDGPPDLSGIQRIPLAELLAGKWDGRLKGSFLFKVIENSQKQEEAIRRVIGLRDGWFLKQPPFSLFVAGWLVGLAGILMAAIFVQKPRIRKLLVVIALVFPVAAVISRALGYRPIFILPAATFYFGILPAVAGHLARAVKDRQRMHRSFRQYLSRDLADNLLAQRSSELLKSQSVEVTVLFMDIRRFTDFSEETPPEEVARILNLFFADMVEIVYARNGTVSKLIGDALFAYFGHPVKCEHADEALSAAREMIAASARTLPPGLTIGIGIHTGQVTVGNLGTDKFMTYNASGETVRIAYELQSHAEGGQILVSGSSLEAIKHPPPVKPYTPDSSEWPDKFKEQVYELDK